MKSATLVPLSIAAALAAGAIYLGVELSGARDELEREVLARGNDAARIRQLEDQNRMLKAALSQGTTAVPEATFPVSTGPLANAHRPPEPMNPADAGPEVPRTGRTAQGRNSPADRNNRRLQEEIQLRRRYADLATALGLDAAQADKLFDLLADHRMSRAENARAYEGDPAGLKAVTDAANRQREADIEALLGPDKAAEFQSFERSMPARMQVNRIGESLAVANVPLSDAQRDSIIAAVAAERSSEPPPRQPDGNATADYRTKFLDWQVDYSRRVQASVEPLLTAEQLKHYRQMVEAQNARVAEMRNREEARRDRQ